MSLVVCVVSVGLLRPSYIQSFPLFITILLFFICLGGYLNIFWYRKSVEKLSIQITEPFSLSDLD